MSNARGFLVAIVMALTCTGCLQEESSITVNPNGSGKYELDLRVRSQALAAYVRTTGRDPADVIPSSRSLLITLLNDVRGIEAWSEALAESTAGGVIHLRLAGYFPDVTRLRPANSFLVGQSLMRAGSIAANPLNEGRTSWGQDSTGRWVLEFGLTDSSSTDSARDARPVTDSEREQLATLRMSINMMTGMITPLLEDSWIRRRVVVPGEIVDGGIFKSVEENRATIEMDLQGMVSATTLILRDDEVARDLFLRSETLRPGEFSARHPGADTVMARAVFGKTGDMRLVSRPGKPPIDYVQETRRVAVVRPKHLVALLEEAKRVAAQETSTGGIKVELPQFNCAVEIPQGWTRLANKPIERGVALNFTKSPLHVSVSAESLTTQIGIDDLETRISANLAAQLTVRTSTSERKTIDSLLFAHVTTFASLKDEPNQKFIFDQWIATRNGFAWRLMCVAPETEAQASQVAAKSLAQGFRIMDPDRAIGAAKDVDRDMWGYSVKGRSTGWTDTSEPSNNHSALLDLYWLRDLEAVVVAPLRFDGDVPDLPALARGFLKIMGFDFPNGGQFRQLPWKASVGEGLEIQAENRDDRIEFEYVFRVVRAKKAAYLLAGWWKKGSGDAERVRTVLDAVQLREPGGRPPAPSPEYRKALGDLLNSAAISYYSRTMLEDAARWSREAYETTESDPEILHNACYVLRESGKSAIALTYLSPRIDRFAEDSDLHVLMANLQLDAGDTLKSEAAFLRAVKLGLDDEDDLLAFMQRLINANRDSSALVACKAQLEKQPSPKVRRWQAEAMRESGNPAGALVLMRRLAEEFPGDAVIFASLIQTLNSAEAFAEAVTAAERWLAANPNDATMIALLGWSQYGRKWYREAKASFERAARLAPQDEEIQNGIRMSSAMLGQGDNTRIKDPVAIVPLPREIREVAEAATLPDETKDRAAVYLMRAEGYSVEPGLPVRHTTHMRIRILTREGATDYSTLEFPFQPLAERIYINRIEVKDKDARVISTGKADDAYVVDQNESMPSGRKVLHAQVHGVAPGCTIEAEVTTERLAPGPELELERHVMAHSVPHALLAVYVTGDTSLFAARIWHGDSVSIVRRERFAAWIAQRPHVERSEPWAARIEDRAPLLMLGTVGPSWEAIGLDYLNSIQDALDPDTRTAALAKELTADATSVREKVAAVARHVQQQIQYKAIEFGRRARRPDAVHKVLGQRYGDCKDHAVLTHQLLEALGIPSDLVLVNTDWRIDPSMPTLDQFNHMVVSIPALGRGWLLDATSKYQQLSALPADGLWHSHGLVLDRKRPHLAPPASDVPLDGYGMTSKRDVSAEGSDWVVRETLTFEGYLAASMRQWLSALGAADRVQGLQGFLDPTGKVQVREAQLVGLDDFSQPLEAKIDYVVKAAVTAREGRSFAIIPAFAERRMLVSPFVKDRNSSFEVTYPFHIRSEVALHLPARPAGFTPTTPLESKDAFCEWKATSVAGGKPADIAITLELRLKAGQFPPAHYSDAMTSWQAPIDALSHRLEW